MKYFKSLGLCLVAVFALSALVASAAQAETSEGPLWIVGPTTRAVAGLLSGQTRAITSRTEAAPVLKGSVASVECEKATNKGVLLGGSPGTAFVEIKFEKCFLKGKPACTATGVNPKGAVEGEIPVNVLVILGFPASGSRTSAVAVFAPESGENLFSEFKFGTNAECGAFKEVAIAVKAKSSKLITINGQERDAGQIAEVGMAEGSTFVLSTPGLVSLVGLLKLPETAIKEATIYNSKTATYEKIEAELTGGGVLGTIKEIATTQIETNPKEEFGWNH
jgi:hypothetical protein